MTCGATWTNREAGLAEIVPVMVETVAQVTVGDSSKLMRTGRAKAKGGNPLGRRKQGADRGSSKVKARGKVRAKAILSNCQMLNSRGKVAPRVRVNPQVKLVPGDNGSLRRERQANRMAVLQVTASLAVEGALGAGAVPAVTRIFEVFEKDFVLARRLCEMRWTFLAQPHKLRTIFRRWSQT